MLGSRSILLLLAASFAATGGAACSDDDDTTPAPTPAPTPTPTPTPTGEEASVRIVHASPDAPAVDVYVEGQTAPVVAGARFGDTSPYITVAPGAYNFQIRAAGAPVTDAPVYSTGLLDLTARSKTTAVAAGLLSGQTDADRFRVLPYTEGFVTAPDKATVRIVHASPDAPTVGIDVGNDDPASPEIASLPRFADTGAGGVQLPADQPLQVGITASGARVTAFTTPSLPAGGDLFVIATGLVGKLARETDGFALLAVGPSGTIGFVKQNPVVFALHASPDAPAVDLFAGRMEVADNLAFGQLSRPIQVPPSTYTIDFFATSAGATRPDGAPAASASTGGLAAGERYLASAIGFLGRPGARNLFTLAVQSEGFNLGDPSKAAVRFWHASPDAPASVDVGVINAGVITPAFTGVEYPTATDPRGMLLEPGIIPIGITPPRESANIRFRFDVPLAAGARVFAVAAGAATPTAGEQGLRLLVVDTKAALWTVTPFLPIPAN